MPIHPHPVKLCVVALTKRQPDKYVFPPATFQQPLMLKPANTGPESQPEQLQGWLRRRGTTRKTYVFWFDFELSILVAATESAI